LLDRRSAPSISALFLRLSTHAPTTKLYALSLHDALPISPHAGGGGLEAGWPRGVEQALQEVQRGFHHGWAGVERGIPSRLRTLRSEEHTSELQSRSDLVCRLLLEKKNEQRGRRQVAVHTV